MKEPAKGSPNNSKGYQFQLQIRRQELWVQFLSLLRFLTDLFLMYLHVWLMIYVPYNLLGLVWVWLVQP